MLSERSIHRWIARTPPVCLMVIVSLLCVSEAAFVTRPDALFRRRPASSAAVVGLRRPSLIHSAPLHMVAKSGGKIINSEEEFAKAALSESIPNPVMVFFTAPWCGPCRLSVPVVKEVIKEYSGSINAVEVCTDDYPEIASDAGVVSIPTIQIYHKGVVKDTIVGCVARKVLSNSVGKVLEEVREATNGDDMS